MTLKIELPAGGVTESSTTIEAAEQTESTARHYRYQRYSGPTTRQGQVSWSLFLKNAIQQAIGERLRSEILPEADSGNLRTRRL